MKGLDTLLPECTPEIQAATQSYYDLLAKKVFHEDDEPSEAERIAYREMLEHQSVDSWSDRALRRISRTHGFDDEGRFVVFMGKNRILDVGSGNSNFARHLA